MNELQRQAYINAMEVDYYTPRLKLPAALASTLCEMPSLSDSTVIGVFEQAKVSSQPLLPKKSSVGVAATHALFEDGTNKREVDGTKPLTVSEAATNLIEQTKVSKSTPKFSLSIVRASNILLIDDGLPGHVNPNDYLQLLHNMVLALGAGKQQLSIDAFVWPINKHSQFDQSENAAKQTLNAFLSKQVEQDNISIVILMGDTAAYYAVEQTLALGELTTHASLVAQVIRCQSGFPMLENSSLKKQVWQQLQPLFQCLQPAVQTTKG